MALRSSEILLNATSGITALKQVLSEEQCVQESESPQEEGSNPTSCNTEPRNATPLPLGACSSKDEFQSYTIYT